MTEFKFKTKGYCHIGLPLTIKDRYWVRNCVSNPDWVSKFAFLPLIYRTKKSHKYKRTKEGKKYRTTKIREICFCSHLDAQVYGYYSQLLSEKYEQWLIDNQLEDCVIAYRSIKAKDGKGKCHIDFANEIFEFIKSQNCPMEVLVSDISDFFGSLNHQLIKARWANLLGLNILPKNHYNVFRNLTHYSYIKEGDLFNLFKNRILTKRGKGIEYKAARVDKKKFLKDRNAVAFCKKDRSELIKICNYLRIYKPNTNNTPDKSPLDSKGIPQGLPISATVANIYMMFFDKVLKQKVSDAGGIYRRYSDDILIAVPKGKLDSILDFLNSSIDKIKLHIAIEKNKRYLFAYGSNGDLICTNQDGQVSKLVYLGFSFNGKDTLIKEQSITRYYARMHNQINKQLQCAFHTKIYRHKRIFENHFLKRFTFLGARHPMDREGNILSSANYGNYLSYILRASNRTGSDKIRHQISRNLSRTKRYSTLANKKVNEFRKFIFPITKVLNIGEMSLFLTLRLSSVDLNKLNYIIEFNEVFRNGVLRSSRVFHLTFQSAPSNWLEIINFLNNNHIESFHLSSTVFENNFGFFIDTDRQGLPPAINDHTELR